MLRPRFGIALFRSIAMVRPKPRHSGHAPSGLLKLNRPGVGGRMSRSQCAQCQPVENGNSVEGAARSAPVLDVVEAAISAALFVPFFVEGAALLVPVLGRDGARPSSTGTTL